MIKLKDLANIIYDDFVHDMVDIRIWDGGNMILAHLQDIKTNQCEYNERYVHYFKLNPFIGGIGRNRIYITMNVYLYDESVKRKVREK